MSVLTFAGLLLAAYVALRLRNAGDRAKARFYHAAGDSGGAWLALSYALNIAAAAIAVGCIVIEIKLIKS